MRVVEANHIKSREEEMAEHIDEAVLLANKLGSIGTVVSQKERDVLLGWIRRWRSVREKVMREMIG